MNFPQFHCFTTFLTSQAYFKSTKLTPNKLTSIQSHSSWNPRFQFLLFIFWISKFSQHPNRLPNFKEKWNQKEQKSDLISFVFEFQLVNSLLEIIGVGCINDLLGVTVAFLHLPAFCYRINLLENRRIWNPNRRARSGMDRIRRLCSEDCEVLMWWRRGGGGRLSLWISFTPDGINL